MISPGKQWGSIDWADVCPISVGTQFDRREGQLGNKDDKSKTMNIPCRHYWENDHLVSNKQCNCPRNNL